MATERMERPGRKRGLVVQKLGDETLVYDQSTHRAHSLNRTASLVFERLDGTNDVRAIADTLEVRTPIKRREALVAAALNELSGAGLVENAGPLPRRAMLRGLAAGLVPVVVSIAVPPAVAAQSCDGLGMPCTPLGYGSSTCCYGIPCVPFGYTYICANP